MAQKQACGTMLEEKNKLIGELKEVTTNRFSFVRSTVFLSVSGITKQRRLLREIASKIR